MPEESATPDLLERVRRLADAINTQDCDAVVSFFGNDGVFDSRAGGRFEGREAIRGFMREWIGAYEDFEFELDEVRDLGHRVTFGVFSQRGRLPGTTGWVEDRLAAVATWADGLIQQATAYDDIDDARAAAERLARDRG